MAKSKPIYLTRGMLLNFAPSPFMLPNPYRDGLTQYQTVEHRFQSMKTIAMRDASRLQRRKAHAQIQHAETARMAKLMGAELDIDLAKWDLLRFNIMLSAVLAKFSQNTRARNALLATDPRPLVEHRHDPIWGDNIDGTGANQMGVILERVRGVFL